MRAVLRPGGLICVCGPLGGSILMGLGHDRISMDVGRWLSSEMSGSCYGKGTVTTIVEICPTSNRIFYTKQKINRKLERLERLHTL